MERLAFNAFVRRAVGRRGCLSLVPRGGLERGGDESPARGQIRYPRARRRLVTCSRADPLPSSEAEIAQRIREGPSNEAEIVPRVRGECEWAARWASLSPFLSSEWEAGRGPSWAQLSYQVFAFLKAVLVPQLGCP